ncbi:Creatininase [Candidatus Koribacter versatilis Ellin345]|uniref:Creatininase n=1 Tax=Koribacter versatilis (strain Ellin345) TaxID=204669 RepID=Q1IR66_KORVE|nr:creatininase family protein [Candidatus Koribacter versatilis]ABF40634.1 Creatininase [Candidatus Koribacter versatilis Ellin345]
MYLRRVVVLVAFLLCSLATYSQEKLSVHWEELTASDFIKGMGDAHNTCALPIGILEKHGPHMPIGTDLLNVRYAALHAAEKEYVIVFPEYYFGQIFEARQEPGTIAYSLDLQLKLLQETVNEMARNGCKKIVIINGHGGNESLLPLFAQAQLATPKDFVVFVYGLPRLEVPGRPAKNDSVDMHAGSSETSHMMVTHPELLKMDKVNTESGRDQDRLKLPDSLYTGIWWYAKFPDHFSGDPSKATRALGEFDVNTWVNSIADAFKAVKGEQGDQAIRLQNEYFEKTIDPIKTKQ